MTTFFSGVAHKKTKIIVGALFLILILLLTIRLLSGDKEILTNTENLQWVETASVRLLSSDEVPLSLIGKVEAKNEADLRAEAQGEVTGVYASLGQFVSAGSILAEISNARERASVAQAEASLDIALSNLSKLTSGARGEEKDILTTSLENAQKNYMEAQLSAQNTLQNTYATIDDILFNKVDALFTSPTTNDPKLSFVIGNRQTVIDAESGRFKIGLMVERLEKNIESLSLEDPLEEILTNTEKDLQEMRTFLNVIADAVNMLQPNASLSENTITTWRANILSSRSSISTSISSIINARTNLTNTKSALSIAKQNKEIGFSGGRNEDVLSAEASVRQAQASLSGAKANLEKTLIRTPISGVVSLLDIKRGDFLPLSTQVAIVSNDNSLIITTYITEAERNSITVGDEVTIQNRYKGLISAVAPTINPITKKIEITIIPIDNTLSIQSGETIRITLNRFKENSLETPGHMRVPIKALKIEPNRTVVFSIHPEDNTLIAHKVSLGPIVGEDVVIEEGIDFDLSIVTDARGLKEGEAVMVK